MPLFNGADSVGIRVGELCAYIYRQPQIPHDPSLQKTYSTQKVPNIVVQALMGQNVHRMAKYWMLFYSI